MARILAYPFSLPVVLILVGAWQELRALIDEHDIALLEDIHIRQWRKQAQYGSGALAGTRPPETMTLKSSTGNHCDAHVHAITSRFDFNVPVD